MTRAGRSYTPTLEQIKIKFSADTKSVGNVVSSDRHQQVMLRGSEMNEEKNNKLRLVLSIMCVFDSLSECHAINKTTTKHSVMFAINVLFLCLVELYSHLGFLILIELIKSKPHSR